MNTKIPFAISDLKKVDPEGRFLNRELPDEFQLERFIDRSQRLNKNLKGHTALVVTYNFSLKYLEEKRDACRLIITNNPVEKYQETIPQFIVKDVQQFMISLATYVRKQYKNKIIGVTGSAGKSTTTKMLWRLLKDDQTDSMVNIGNHNDRHSVPYYLANTLRNPEFLTLEFAGDSLLKHKRFGNLTELAKLDIGIVTTIGGAHLSKYKDDLNVAEIKSALVEGIKIGGTLIINQDISEDQKEIFIRKAKDRSITIFTYSSTQRNADAYLINREWNGDYSRVTACIGERKVNYEVPGGSEGSVQNSLSVLLALEILGVDLSSERLKKFKLVKTLPRVLTKKQFSLVNNERLLLIDDTHNSSTHSAINAINYFKLMAESGHHKGNKLMIFAKIADLGEKSQEIHYQFIEPLANAGADYIFLYGEQMKDIMKELRKKKIMAYHFDNLETLIEETMELIVDDSMIVFKGSRWESNFEDISKLLPEKIISSGGKLLT